MNAILPCLCLLFLLVSTPVAGQGEGAGYVIHAGKLFDPEQGAFLTDQYIFTTGETIERIAPAGAADTTGYRYLDLADATVLPGLIDAHTHLLTRQRSDESLEFDAINRSDRERLLRAVELAGSYLRSGVTTVRDLGNSGQFLDLDLRDAIGQGWVAGPTLYASGPIISPENGQFGTLPDTLAYVIDQEYRVIATEDDARMAVLDHARRGVDLIKVAASNDNGTALADSLLLALVETARASGLRVTAHAPYDAVIRSAIAAGVDGIEHGYTVSDSTLQLMADRGIYLVPTDGTSESYTSIVEAGNGTITAEQIAAFVQATQDRLARAVRIGVPIVFGSDSYLVAAEPVGVAAKQTLVAYHRSGMSVAEVLRAATASAARALGREGTLGVLQPGAVADIVAFSADLPEAFETAILADALFVMQGGKVVVGR